MARTAIIILNWNGIAYLKMFLGKVVKFSSGDGTVIYIADNGSTDGSVDWVEENFANIRIIRFGTNHGFPGGYNLALDQVEADYYVLLNSDIEVTKGWLEPLIKELDENPLVASCQPKVLSYKQREYFEYAGAAGGFIDKLCYPLCRGRVFYITEKDNGQYDDPSDIFWSTGACMATRSAAWKKVKGFDPDFFAHMEEIDLCWRFHRAGYTVRFVPSSTVYHVGGGSLPYNSPFKTYLNFRNSLYLMYKNLPGKNFRSKLFARRILDAVAAIFFLLKGQPRSTLAVWKAHRDASKNISILREKRKLVRELGDNENPGLILNKYVVFEFYIKKHVTFGSMKIKS
jgi:hypothetical protein